MKGELLKSIQTKSGNMPADIAVTRSGGLVYTDRRDRSINLVSGTQIQTLITLWGWKPDGLCSTFSGDLLVIVTSDDEEQQKSCVTLVPERNKQFNRTTKVTRSIHLIITLKNIGTQSNLSHTTVPIPYKYIKTKQKNNYNDIK